MEAPLGISPTTHCSHVISALLSLSLPQGQSRRVDCGCAEGDTWHVRGAETRRRHEGVTSGDAAARDPMRFDFSQEYVDARVAEGGDGVATYTAAQRKSRELVTIRVAPTKRPTSRRWLSRGDQHIQKEQHMIDLLPLRLTIRHSNLPLLRDTLMTSSGPCHVTEYEGHVTLSQLIAARPAGFLSEDVAKGLIRQLASGVRYLHELQVVHRNISPDCCRLRPDLHLTLGGLENCHQLTAAEEKLSGNVGVAGYTAPELHQGEPYLPLPADVFATGACLKMMATSSPVLLELAVSNHFLHLDLSLQQLLITLLEDSPARRATITQLLRSAWMKEPAAVSCSGIYSLAPLRKLSSGAEEVEVKKSWQI